MRGIFLAAQRGGNGGTLRPMDLKEHLDAHGDLAPPWEQFPHYERSTIGWRMGAGEDWLIMWHDFLADLDLTARVAYLRRHPPAPITWAASVYLVLHSSEEGDDEEADDLASEHRAALLRDGYIASDIAYPTWLKQQDGVVWPWTYAKTPEITARYRTRELWFWSRQVADLRRDPSWRAPSVPDAWHACAAELESGTMGALDLKEGLLSLSRMLCAGQVIPPWHLRLQISDFVDSFEDDMAYADAFRLWGMSAFDDDEQIRHYLEQYPPPDASWTQWIAEQLRVD